MLEDVELLAGNPFDENKDRADEHKRAHDVHRKDKLGVVDRVRCVEAHEVAILDDLRNFMLGHAPPSNRAGVLAESTPDEREASN